MLVAVLRDVTHSVLGALADALVGDILAVQRKLAARHLAQAGQAVDELGLAVALDARQTDDLACVHLEGHVLHHVLLALVIVDGNVFHVQHSLAGVCGLLFHLQLHVTAHHAA